MVKTYSGGMRRRLDLASALIGRPSVLFMDEPTTGLDPRSRLGMWDVIRGLVKEGTTLLLTTQYLEEADELANTIAVVDHGKIIARGTSDELKSQVGGERIDVVVREPGSIPRVSDLLAALDTTDAHVTVDRAHAPFVDCHEQRSRLPADACRQLADEHIAIDDIGLHRPTLDDVFLSLTGHAAEERAESEERKPAA